MKEFGELRVLGRNVSMEGRLKSNVWLKFPDRYPMGNGLLLIPYSLRSPTLFGVLCELLVEGGVVVFVLVLVLLNKPHQGGELSRDPLEVELPLVIKGVDVLKLDRHFRDFVDDFFLGREIRIGIDHQD